MNKRRVSCGIPSRRHSSLPWGDNRLARRPPARRHAAAFTLVELLVVMAILAILIGVIGACLSGAIRVWDAVRTHGETEAQMSIAMRILERDIANATPFCDVGFRGDAAEMTFAGLLRGASGASAPAGWRDVTVGADSSCALAVVRYRYEASRMALLRSRQPCRPETAVAGSGSETLLTGVQELSFQYEAVGEDGTRRTQAEWNSRTNFPAAVRVDLTTKSDRGLRRTVRSFRVPVQVLPPFAPPS